MVYLYGFNLISSLSTS